MTAAVTAATEFEQVAVDYAAISPMLIVVAGALVGVLVEAFAPRRSRHGIQVWLTALVLLGAFAAVVTLSRTNQTVTLGGSVVVDGVSVFLMGALLLLSVISVLIMGERFGGVHCATSPCNMRRRDDRNVAALARPFGTHASREGSAG